jgi:hypothetical protein
MTQRTAILFSVVLAVSTLTGCMESATLIRVGKDGSGTITHRMYMSTDMMDMMQGMASGMVGATGETGADMPEIDPLADMKASLKDQFGVAATLEGTKDVVNAAGWKGVEATYKFANVNDLDMTASAKAEDDGMGMEPNGPTYKFEFTPGDTATLKLVPLGQDGAAADEVPAAQTTADAGDAESAVPEMEMEGMDAMGNMGMQMMAPMLKGMRMSLLVAVDGKVVESNASFPHPSHANVVTLADIDFDKLLAHPEGMKALQAGPDANPADLAKLGIDGVKVEDPAKEIVIRFE